MANLWNYPFGAQPDPVVEGLERKKGYRPPASHTNRQHQPGHGATVRPHVASAQPPRRSSSKRSPISLLATVACLFAVVYFAVCKMNCSYYPSPMPSYPSYRLSAISGITLQVQSGIEDFEQAGFSHLQSDRDGIDELYPVIRDLTTQCDQTGHRIAVEHTYYIATAPVSRAADMTGYDITYDFLCKKMGLLDQDISYLNTSLYAAAAKAERIADSLSIWDGDFQRRGKEQSGAALVDTNEDGHAAAKERRRLEEQWKSRANDMRVWLTHIAEELREHGSRYGRLAGVLPKPDQHCGEDIIQSVADALHSLGESEEERARFGRYYSVLKREGQCICWICEFWNW